MHIVVFGEILLTMLNKTNGTIATSYIFDKLYGTKQFTAGAELQLPRKVPIRVEPKSYFGKAASDFDVFSYVSVFLIDDYVLNLLLRW